MPNRQSSSPLVNLRADDVEIGHYAALLDSLDIALLVFAEDASLHFRNARGDALFDNKPLAWIDENGQPIDLPEQAQMQALETAKPAHARIVGLADTDGSNIWLKAEAFPVLAKDGSVRRALLTLTDISERRTLQNEIEQLSIRDPLTGLFNQRHIMHLLENEMHRARRYGTPFTLAQLDIDHFLPFCAEHGPRTGDSLLAGLGKLLGESMRETDFAGRIGNDEFLLILPNVRLNDAMVGLERLRVLIEAQAFTSAGLNVTISGGITEYTGENMAALVERSTSLLIHARAAGRNRFCLDADIL